MTLERTGIVAAMLVAAIALGVGLTKPADVIERVETRLGSNTIAAQDGCLEFGPGGAYLCAMTQRMKNASTTCSFKPFMASSTLIRATARVERPFGGTFSVEFGKATTAFATTTQLGVMNSVANGDTIFASTSQNVALIDSAYAFESGDFFNVKLGSSSPTVQGVCTAVFMSI